MALRADLDVLKSAARQLDNPSVLDRLVLEDSTVSWSILTPGGSRARVSCVVIDVDAYPGTSVLLYCESDGDWQERLEQACEKHFADRAALGDVIRQTLTIFGHTEAAQQLGRILSSSQQPVALNISVSCSMGTTHDTACGVRDNQQRRGAAEDGVAAMELSDCRQCKAGSMGRASTAGGSEASGMEEDEDADQDHDGSSMATEEASDYASQPTDGGEEGGGSSSGDEEGGGSEEEDERQLTIECIKKQGRWERFEAAREEQEAQGAGVSAQQATAKKLQIFDSREAFLMLSRELLGIFKQQSYEVIADSIGDDLYRWRVELSGFSPSSGLGQDMIELQRRHRYSSVCLTLTYMRGLHPFYPASLEIVRPHLKHWALGAAASHPMLQLANWDPLRPQSALIHQIKLFLEANTRVDLDSPLNDIQRFPTSCYWPSQRQLATLEALTGVAPLSIRGGPQHSEEVTKLYEARDSYGRDAARLQALHTQSNGSKAGEVGANKKRVRLDWSDAGQGKEGSAAGSAASSSAAAGTAAGAAAVTTPGAAGMSGAAPEASSGAAGSELLQSFTGFSAAKASSGMAGPAAAAAAAAGMAALSAAGKGGGGGGGGGGGVVEGTAAKMAGSGLSGIVGSGSPAAPSASAMAAGSKAGKAAGGSSGVPPSSVSPTGSLLLQLQLKGQQGPALGAAGASATLPHTATAAAAKAWAIGTAAAAAAKAGAVGVVGVGEATATAAELAAAHSAGAVAGAAAGPSSLSASVAAAFAALASTYPSAAPGPTPAAGAGPGAGPGPGGGPGMKATGSAEKKKPAMYWAPGTGYGHGARGGQVWDASASEAAQRVWDAELRRLILALARSLSRELSQPQAPSTTHPDTATGSGSQPTAPGPESAGAGGAGAAGARPIAGAGAASSGLADGAGSGPAAAAAAAGGGDPIPRPMDCSLPSLQPVPQPTVASAAAAAAAAAGGSQHMDLDSSALGSSRTMPRTRHQKAMAVVAAAELASSTAAAAAAAASALPQRVESMTGSGSGSSLQQLAAAPLGLSGKAGSGSQPHLPSASAALPTAPPNSSQQPVASPQHGPSDPAGPTHPCPAGPCAGGVLSLSPDALASLGPDPSKQSSEQPAAAAEAAEAALYPFDPDGCAACLASSCLVPLLIRETRRTSFGDMCRRVPYYTAVLKLVQGLCCKAGARLLVQRLPLEDGASCLAEVIPELMAPAQIYIRFTWKLLLENVAEETRLAALAKSSGSAVAAAQHQAAADSLAELRSHLRLAVLTSEVASQVALLAADLQQQQQAVVQPVQQQQQQQLPGPTGKNSRQQLRVEQQRQEDETYIAAMKPLQVLEVSRLGEAGHLFAAEARREGVSPSERITALGREISALASDLPLSANSSVFVALDDEKMMLWRAVIVGPTDTPYAGGCFIFDLYFPPTYPQVCPQVKLKTTGGGKVRFNPNLYNCGKVCLSLLGTWMGEKGEGWLPKVSTANQVFLSIQSLILVDRPYFNEPGYERMMGTPQGEASSKSYNVTIREATLRYAMIDLLKHPPAELEAIIKTHFRLRQSHILKCVDGWIADAAGNSSHASNLAHLKSELAACFKKL